MTKSRVGGPATVRLCRAAGTTAAIYPEKPMQNTTQDIRSQTRALVHAECRAEDRFLP